MTDKIPKFLNWRPGRFLFGGIANTIVTYSIYLILSFYFFYQFAFFASYLIGIIFSYLVNSRFVFQVNLSWEKFIIFPLVYIGQYAASASIMFLAVEVFDVDSKFAPFAVIALVTPVTYVFTRFVLVGKFSLRVRKGHLESEPK